MLLWGDAWRWICGDARTPHRETLDYPRIRLIPPRRAHSRMRRIAGVDPAQQALRRPVPVHGDGARPTLRDFVDVPDVYPAGRLDADSEGLVVLTADGALQARIADPRHKLAQDLLGAGRRRARGRAARATGARRVARRRSDAAGASAHHRGAAVVVAARSADSRAQAHSHRVAGNRALREGRNRQVRRMTAAVGLPTLRLVRWSVGRWTLDGLAPGESRRRRRAMIARRSRDGGQPRRMSAPAPLVPAACATSARCLSRDDPPPARPPDPRPADARPAHLRADATIRCGSEQVPRGARTVTREAAGGGIQGVRRRRRRARPAARPDAEGLRHRDQRDARAGEAAVPPRLHHRPPLPARARARRRGSARGLDVPRARRPATTRPTSTAGCCRTTSTARRREDAARRDFTINALYFDPITEEIWDYVGGVADVRARRLKLIGAAGHALPRGPGAHAARGAARGEGRRGDRPQDRGADPQARAASSRTCRRRGCSTRCRSCCCPATRSRRCKSLRAHGLSHGLLPLLDVILEQPLGPKFIDAALAGTDARVREGKAVSPAFLFATLLWHEVLQQWNAAKARGEKPLPALFDGDGPRAGAAGAAHLDPAPLRGRRSRRSGRCSRASSSAPARGRTGCSSTALSRRLRFPRAARQLGRGAAGARRLVDAIPGRRRRRARGDAEAGRGAEEEPPLARPRPQARRDAMPAARRRRAIDRRRWRTDVRDADRRIRRAGQQPRPPAPPARARRWPRSRSCRARASVRRVAQLRDARRSACATRSPTTSTRSRPCARRLRRARCCGDCRRSSGASVAAATPGYAAQRAADARPRFATIRHAAGSASRSSTFRIRACTSARSCCVRCSTSRRRSRFPGRGLARRHWRAVRGQRIARTRTHFCTDHYRSPPWTSSSCRYIVVEGPIGAGKTSLARQLADASRRRDAARAAGGQSVPGALLRRHAALRAAHAAHVPVPARRPAARAGAARPVPAARRSPISCSTRIRCSRGSTSPTTSTRSTTRCTRT